MLLFWNVRVNPLAAVEVVSVTGDVKPLNPLTATRIVLLPPCGIASPGGLSMTSKSGSVAVGATLTDAPISTRDPPPYAISRRKYGPGVVPLGIDIVSAA